MNPSAETEIRVWDPLLRLFHWLLVAAFAIAYITEDDWLGLHVLAGYAVLGLLGFRLLWGFAGPRRARFKDFLYPLPVVGAYLRSLWQAHPLRYLGHNPAGGLMVIVLLLVLFAVVLSGLAVYAADQNAGFLAPWLGGAGKATEKLLEEVHETLANLSLALVFVHILGVLAESYIHRDNLARAMLTGRKQGRHGDLG